MKTAREFLDALIPRGVQWVALVDAIEARDREVRAAALEQAAQLFTALIRHSVDGYVRLTSVAEQLREMFAHAERGE